MFDRVTIVLSRRKLVTMLDGYLGIAPSKAKQGDVICILLRVQYGYGASAIRLLLLARG
jgi:hypothetical protein